MSLLSVSSIFRALALPSALISLVIPTAMMSLADKQSSSSSSSNAAPSSAPAYSQEKSPSIVDPAGPAIELVSSETLFIMAATLNACGYDEGLTESDPARQRIRDEVNRALAASEDARAKRDLACKYIAQHRITGTVKDVSQFISLALYLTPQLETSVELPQMPPDSTQVVEFLPYLRDFSAAVDLHGIWIAGHRTYDELVKQLHDPITQMIVSTNYYLKMPASTYDGRRFVVVVEPQLSPHVVNARVYGTDYVVVVSPAVVAPAAGLASGSAQNSVQAEQIRMNEVRHSYLHYMIEPMLYSHSTATERFLPLLKAVRGAPLEYRFRSDVVELAIESLIKAVEARTMDTGIASYVAPPNARRSDFERIEHDRSVVQQKQETIRRARVKHDVAQGYIMTTYFYEQLIQFEKDPASLKDSIGELVYSMDVDNEAHRARQIVFDQQADDDVLRRTPPRKLTGLDLAEAKLAAGDLPAASKLATLSLTESAKEEAANDPGRANFILARVAILSGHPDQAIDGFQKAATNAKETRILAWSHIYLGRILDLECQRDNALAEYKQALAVRDGQQDTRIAAERGVKTAYAPIKEHTCQADPDAGPDAGSGAGPGADSDHDSNTEPNSGHATKPGPAAAGKSTSSPARQEPAPASPLSPKPR